MVLLAAEEHEVWLPSVEEDGVQQNVGVHAVLVWQIDTVLLETSDRHSRRYLREEPSVPEKLAWRIADFAHIDLEAVLASGTRDHLDAGRGCRDF